MNLPQVLQLPFGQIALPLMVVLIVNAWGQNKRVDDLRADMNRRFDEFDRRFDAIEIRLERIETKLDNHQDRIVALEERTSPLRGR